MTKKIHNLRLTLIAGLASLAVTACVPGQYAYETNEAGANAGYYDNSAYYGGQYGYEAGNYGQYEANVSTSRYGIYGAATNTSGLRPGCDMQMAPCGFMRVVPVYPIYQVTAPQTPAPVVEAPAVEIYEPEPAVIYEPEPVYEPAPEPEPVYTPPPSYWPEPDTPVQSWKPIRK